MKVLKNILCLSAAMAVSFGVSGRYHAPYEYPRLFWDISTQKVIFQSGNYARLITLQDGRLMAAAESYGPSGIKVCYSMDKGKNWTSPELIAPNPDKVGNAVPDLIQLSDGTILVGYNPRPGAPYSEDRRFGIRTMRSTDNGQTWEGPIYIYDASHIGEDGCWEPSFLEMPDGEVHCYFANEHPYTQSGEQEISMCRSFDKGLTWSDPERVTFRSGHRDGMPVAVVMQGNQGVLFIEESVNGGVPPTLQHRALDQEWETYDWDGVDDNRRWRTSLASGAGAPYCIQLPTGEFVIAAHTDQTGSVWQTCRPQIVMTDNTGHNFRYSSKPLAGNNPLPYGTGAYYNSLQMSIDFQRKCINIYPDLHFTAIAAKISSDSTILLHALLRGRAYQFEFAKNFHPVQPRNLIFCAKSS